MRILDFFIEQAPAMTAIRRQIHAHPELCYEEVHTSDLVAKKLAEWGIPVHRGLGKTGLVGVIKGDAGESSRSIGLRADMDALPMQEYNQFAHASTIPGKMHACGHDGHTAMLLAAAEYLQKHKSEFKGNVYLIFQPAEEGGGGAKAMIEDGLFERFPMEAVFGIHNWPNMPAGQFAVSSGPVMASSNEFSIKITGKGSHAALPYMGVDPVPIACQIVNAFQTIISRNKKPVEAGVLSVTKIHGGEATNVVPDYCTLEGTVRTFSHELLDLIEQRMQDIAQHTCAAFGAECHFEFVRNYPPTINHSAESEFVRDVIVKTFGEDQVSAQEPTMGAEDFSYMLLEKPGCYLFIGNGEGDHRVLGHGEGPCTLHNPNYDFNDQVIPVGATFWVELVKSWMDRS